MNFKKMFALVMVSSSISMAGNIPVMLFGQFFDLLRAGPLHNVELLKSNEWELSHLVTRGYEKTQIPFWEVRLNNSFYEKVDLWWRLEQSTVANSTQRKIIFSIQRFSTYGLSDDAIKSLNQATLATYTAFKKYMLAGYKEAGMNSDGLFHEVVVNNHLVRYSPKKANEVDVIEGARAASGQLNPTEPSVLISFGKMNLEETKKALEIFNNAMAILKESGAEGLHEAANVLRNSQNAVRQSQSYSF